MDNRFIKGSKPGHHHQPKGWFSWWPVAVWKGCPWPEEVPVLGAGNFTGRRPDGTWFRDSPDRRHVDEWVRGFPRDKGYRVGEAVKQAIKGVTGRGIGGSYKIWMWADKQDGATKACVWNRAMEILGYTERVG